jgi:uncharacterized membrane protein
VIGGRQLVTAQDAPFDIIVAVTVTVDTCFARVWRRDFRQGVDLVLRQLAGIVHIPRNAYNVRPVATIGIVNVPVTDCTIAGAETKIKRKKERTIYPRYGSMKLSEPLLLLLLVSSATTPVVANNCKTKTARNRNAALELVRSARGIVLFCFVLFCFVLFRSVLFCSVSFIN